MPERSPERAASSDPVQPDRKEFVPAWQNNALFVVQTTGGARIIMEKPGVQKNGTPYWNPDVAPGQKLQAKHPKILDTPYDIGSTNQLVALKNPLMMNRIKDWIDARYGSGAGNNITNLTPREGMELARRILGERTEYSLEQLEKSETTQDVMETLKERKRMPLEDLMKISRSGTMHMNDRRDVESLLREPDDLDVVCRNQSETLAVLFEAIKMLQKKDLSLLNTSFVQVFDTPVRWDQSGTLPTGEQVNRIPGTEDYYAIRLEKGSSFSVTQKEMANFPQAKGEVWILSEAEKKQIRFGLNPQDLGETVPEENHALVAFVTEDRYHRYRVLPVNSTVEGEGADADGAEFAMDAMIPWKKSGDVSWNQLRIAADKIAEKMPDSRRRDIVIMRYPLLILNDAKEKKVRVSPAEIEWCAKRVREIDKHLSSWFNSTDSTEQDELVNIAVFFIESGEWDHAEETIRVCKGNGAYQRGRTEGLDVFDERISALEASLAQRRNSDKKIASR